MRRLATAVLFAAMAPGLCAQSFNLDFGAPASAQGAPAPGYRAAGRAGVWNAVGARGASNLIGLNGVATGVSVSFSDVLSEVQCDHSLTAGDDDALLDDRLEFPPGHGGMTIDIAGLEPGIYRVRLYAIRPDQGGCQPDELLVRIGNDWQSMFLDWGGSFVRNQSYTFHRARRPVGGDLQVHVEGYVYGQVWLSGLQIENVLRPIPLGGIPGIASAALPFRGSADWLQ